MMAIPPTYASFATLMMAIPTMYASFATLMTAIVSDYPNKKELTWDDKIAARLARFEEDKEVMAKMSADNCCVHIQQCDVSWDVRHYMSTSCQYDSQ